MEKECIELSLPINRAYLPDDFDIELEEIINDINEGLAPMMVSRVSITLKGKKNEG